MDYGVKLRRSSWHSCFRVIFSKNVSPSPRHPSSRKHASRRRRRRRCHCSCLSRESQNMTFETSWMRDGHRVNVQHQEKEVFKKLRNHSEGPISISSRPRRFDLG